MNKSATLLLSAALGLSFLSVQASAEPRDRAAKMAKPPHAATVQRKVDRKRENGTQKVDISVTTADGRTLERHIETTRTEDGFTRTMEGTTPNGKTFSRTATGTRDAETGTWSREVNGTTPGGKTFSNTVEGQRTEDGYTRVETRTGPNGGTHTRTTVATRNEDGSISKEVTHTTTPPQNEQPVAE